MRKIFLSILTLSALLQAEAQTVTGSWYGKAAVNLGSDNSNNYLTELQIRQKGNEVDGVLGYYFRDQYQSFFIRGTYDKNSRELVIRDIPMPYFKSNSRFTIDCPMNLSLILNSSQVGKTLKGHFFSLEEYKNTCGDLAVQFTLDATDLSYDSTFRAGFTSKKVWKPNEEDVVITATSILKDNGTAITGSGTKPAAEVKDLVMQKKPDLKSLFSMRKTIISDNISVSSDSIRVSLYDNGEVDGDSVSVFLNGVPVINHQSLTARALTIYCTLDSTKEVNEISMFAENLGRYPPNTALMVISDGVNNFEVYMSSTLNQNATVRIRRKK